MAQVKRDPRSKGCKKNRSQWSDWILHGANLCLRLGGFSYLRNKEQQVAENEIQQIQMWCNLLELAVVGSKLRSWVHFQSFHIEEPSEPKNTNDPLQRSYHRVANHILEQHCADWFKGIYPCQRSFLRIACKLWNFSFLDWAPFTPFQVHFFNQ